MVEVNKIPHGYKMSEVGIIPEEWKVSTVKESYDICNNLRMPISQDKRNKMQGQYPYYGPTKIQDYINEYRIEGKYALIGEDGDHFLKYSTKPMTLLVDGKFNVNNHAHIVKGRIGTTEWFYLFFCHRDITQVLSRQGAGRYKLNKATLEKLNIALPSVSEQKFIYEIIKDTENLIVTIEKLICKKKLIKKGSMQELLTGKRRINGYNSKWKYEKLKNLAKMESGGTPNTNNKEYYNGNIPWAVIADITETGKYIYRTKKNISNLGLKYSTAKLFKKDIILFAMYASIGKCAISKIPTTCNQAILGIDTLNINSEFLYYYLSFKENEFIMLGQTGAQSNLNKEIEALQKKLDKYKKIKEGMMEELLTGKRRLI